MVDTQYLAKLSVVPIELWLICVQCRFRIPVVTQISGLLLILCHQKHDSQFKMHHKALKYQQLVIISFFVSPVKK